MLLCVAQGVFPCAAIRCHTKHVPAEIQWKTLGKLNVGSGNIYWTFVRQRIPTEENDIRLHCLAEKPSSAHYIGFQSVMIGSDVLHNNYSVICVGTGISGDLHNDNDRWVTVLGVHSAIWSLSIHTDRGWAGVSSTLLREEGDDYFIYPSWLRGVYPEYHRPGGEITILSNVNLAPSSNSDTRRYGAINQVCDFDRKLVRLGKVDTSGKLPLPGPYYFTRECNVPSSELLPTRPCTNAIDDEGNTSRGILPFETGGRYSCRASVVGNYRKFKKRCEVIVNVGKLISSSPWQWLLAPIEYLYGVAMDYLFKHSETMLFNSMNFMERISPMWLFKGMLVVTINRQLEIPLVSLIIALIIWNRVSTLWS